MRTRQTLVVNENIEGAMESMALYRPGTEPEKIAGIRSTGGGRSGAGLVLWLILSVRMHSAIRTYASCRPVNSMSVALENARLFSETQRLLLRQNSATVNWRSSQRPGCACRGAQHPGHLRTVGDKIRAISTATISKSAFSNPITNLEQFPYLTKKVTASCKSLSPHR